MQRTAHSYITKVALDDKECFFGWWLNRLINKAHLFMVGFSKLLLGVVSITMVSFWRQPWSRGKVEEDRKTAFVDRGFPSDCNPFINRSRLWVATVLTHVTSNSFM